MASGVTKEVTKQREAQAWELRQQGMRQSEIARTIGISQPAVSLMLNRLSVRSEAALTELAVQTKVEQAIRLEGIYVEAMKAWHASKKPKIKRCRRRDSKGRESETLEAIEQVGNPDFLKRAMEALAAQRDLLGLNATCPSKQSPQTEAKTQLAHYHEIQARLGHDLLERVASYKQ